MKKLSVLLTALFLAGCCQGQSGPAPAAPGAPAAAADSKAVVAEIDGEKITDADLSQAVAGQLSRVQAEIFEIKQQGLDAMIEQKLVAKEAKKRGVSAEELIKVEVLEKVGEIPDREVEDFYNQNKARLGGRTLEEVKGPIKQQMFARKASIYRNNLIDRLKSEAKVVVLLEAPKVEVSVDDDPSMGNKKAPVVIVEFTDYQCPFCAKARPAIKQLLAEYGDKIHYVLRDYPLDFHPLAKKAAEAAQCAGDQGKYWEYSDLLWANQGALDAASLKKYAGELKLDAKKFDACLDEGKYAAEVDKDFADGAKAGVSGTPSFFINGVPLTGAQPFEKFKEIVDRALAKKSQS